MTSSTDRIAFLDYHQPTVTAGDYTLSAEQHISLDSEPFAAKRRFSITGERFALSPSLIHSVFPPAGSLGDHSNVLPHVVLSRSTLPWERFPHARGERTPWLALLSFTDAERPDPATVTLAELSRDPAYFPAFTLERLEQPADQVTVIDVPRGLLADLLPSFDELPYLAHLRRADDELSVVVGKRLPPAGMSTTVHLVSLEGRYTAVENGKPAFDFGDDHPDAHLRPIRLVSLHSWRFACASADQTFAKLVRNLSHDDQPFQLADTGNQSADGFLRQGFVPARHELRQGTQTVSFYRGPFATGAVDDEQPEPVRTADRLLRYYADTGVFDVGYAAAWQLGRLLGLRSTTYATALYEWRRRRDQDAARDTANSAPPSDYPLEIPAIDTTIPATVTTWLAQLRQLAGVPMSYLVPDERLLPTETVRFVALDQQWMYHLIDGAYSVGRLNDHDTGADRQHPPLPPVTTPITGALIRSGVVSGYPGLLVDAYADTDSTGQEPLPKALSRRLASDVLLCLFAGDLARLDLHQAPEPQHFAVEPHPGDQFTRTLRALDANADSAGATAPLSFGPRRTLPVLPLVAAMTTALSPPQPLASGDFARQMIETAERVSFLRTTSHSRHYLSVRSSG